MIGAGYPLRVTVPSSIVWLRSISLLVITISPDRIGRVPRPANRPRVAKTQERAPADWRAPAWNHTHPDLSSGALLVGARAGGRMHRENRPVERQAAVPNGDDDDLIDVGEGPHPVARHPHRPTP